MRTMPSDTLVTVPSLRASAPSLTFSMRVLISSLISDGLSVVVAIVLFPWRCVATCGAPLRFAFRDWGFGIGDSESRNLALSNPEFRIPNHGFTGPARPAVRSEEHTPELQSLLRI